MDYFEDWVDVKEDFAKARLVVSEREDAADSHLMLDAYEAIYVETQSILSQSMSLLK